MFRGACNELMSRLMVACSTGRGVDSVVACVCTGENWRGSAPTINKFIRSALVDNLNLDIAIYTVDKVLQQAQRARAVSISTKSSVAERAAKSMRPFLRGWMHIFLGHTTSASALEKVWIISSRWQENGWFLKNDYSTLMRAYIRQSGSRPQLATRPTTAPSEVSPAKRARTSSGSHEAGTTIEQTPPRRGVPPMPESAAKSSRMCSKVEPVQGDGALGSHPVPGKPRCGPDVGVELRETERAEASPFHEDGAVEQKAGVSSAVGCVGTGAGVGDVDAASDVEKVGLRSLTCAMPSLWKVAGDCRCLFRAVYRGVKDPENNIPRDDCGEPINLTWKARERRMADKFRAKTCQVMREREVELAELLAGTESVSDYISKMQEWQTWGDAICLHYLPDVAKRPIQVYALNEAEQYVFDSGMHLPSDMALHAEHCIVLFYNGSSHYDLVSMDWLRAQERALCGAVV